MGVTTSRYRTFNENVIESQEELLGEVFFAFLAGGHIASMWEFWTLLCNIAITALVLGAIEEAICVQCCIPRIKARRLLGEVAEVVATDQEDTNVDDVLVTDSETASQDSKLTRQYISGLTALAELVKSAPPPYTPLYPTLPTSESTEDFALLQ